MLGKLFKHEFKDTCKVMLTLYAVLAVFTLFGMFTVPLPGMQDSDNVMGVLFTVVYILIYILAILACSIITTVYLTIHFYKTMYSARGYLTHTLPVNPLTTFHVKLVVSAFWTFLTLLLIMLSLAGLLWSIAVHADTGYALEYTFNEAKALYLSSLGMRSSEFVIYMFFAYLLGCFLSPLRLYLSCSIGQLFNQQKVVASIIAGIVIYFAHSSIVSFFTNALEHYKYSENLMYRDTAWLLLSIDLLFVIIFYIGNYIIIKKHINLE